MITKNTETSVRLCRILVLSFLALGLPWLALGQSPLELSNSDVTRMTPNPIEYVHEGLLSLDQNALFLIASTPQQNPKEVKAACDKLLQDKTLPFAFRRWATMKSVRMSVLNQDEPKALELAKHWIEENPTDDALNLRLKCFLTSVFTNGALENWTYPDFSDSFEADAFSARCFSKSIGVLYPSEL